MAAVDFHLASSLRPGGTIAYLFPPSAMLRIGISDERCSVASKVCTTKSSQESKHPAKPPEVGVWGPQTSTRSARTCPAPAKPTTVPSYYPRPPPLPQQRWTDDSVDLCRLRMRRCSQRALDSAAVGDEEFPVWASRIGRPEAASAVH